MASDESEQMLGLLQELSVLKELEKEYETGPKTQPERDEHQHQLERQKQISEEIKQVAAEKDRKREP